MGPMGNNSLNLKNRQVNFALSITKLKQREKQP